MTPTARLLLPLSLLCTTAHGDPAPDGQRLYTAHCSACHLDSGEGDDTAPDIRGQKRATLKRALRGFDQMPEFDLAATEIDALAAYLAVLDTPR